jgi:hypothetical protein
VAEITRFVNKILTNVRPIICNQEAEYFAEQECLYVTKLDLTAPYWEAIKQTGLGFFE